MNFKHTTVDYYFTFFKRKRQLHFMFDCGKWWISMLLKCIARPLNFNSTHWGRMTHICVRKLRHHWQREWFVVWLAPSHYLTHSWNIINQTFRNNHQWNFNRNSYIIIHGNAFENIVSNMAAMLPRPQWNNCKRQANGKLWFLIYYLKYSNIYQH